MYTHTHTHWCFATIVISSRMEGHFNPPHCIVFYPSSTVICKYESVCVVVSVCQNAVCVCVCMNNACVGTVIMHVYYQ